MKLHVSACICYSENSLSLGSSKVVSAVINVDTVPGGTQACCLDNGVDGTSG